MAQRSVASRQRVTSWMTSAKDLAHGLAAGTGAEGARAPSQRTDAGVDDFQEASHLRTIFNLLAPCKHPSVSKLP